MWNKTSTVNFTKARKTSEGALYREADLELQQSMLAWPVMLGMETGQLHLDIPSWRVSFGVALVNS